jgi:hypothetical protein
MKGVLSTVLGTFVSARVLKIAVTSYRNYVTTVKLIITLERIEECLQESDDSLILPTVIKDERASEVEAKRRGGLSPS